MTDCLNCGGTVTAPASRNRKYCSNACYHAAKVIRRDLKCGTGNRQCSKCSTIKSEAEFYTHGQRGPSTWCKDCRKADEKARRSDVASIQLHLLNYEHDPLYRAKLMRRGVAKRARAEGVEFGIGLEWLVARLKAGRCEVTGLPFDMSIAERKAGMLTPSVDRIRAGGPYTEGNCRLVVLGLNLAIRDWGLERFMEIAEALVLARSRERDAA